MRNIEKNCLQGLKRQNKLFANTICKTSEKSDKLLKIISSKTEIKSKSNNFCYKFYQHRIFKLNKHIKTNNKLVNS